MTATELSDEDSGRTPPLFFSRTVPSSASCERVGVWCAALVAVCAGEPAGGSSNRP